MVIKWILGLLFLGLLTKTSEGRSHSFTGFTSSLSGGCDSTAVTLDDLTIPECTYNADKCAIERAQVTDKLTACLGSINRETMEALACSDTFKQELVNRAVADSRGYIWNSQLYRGPEPGAGGDPTGTVFKGLTGNQYEDIFIRLIPTDLVPTVDGSNFPIVANEEDKNAALRVLKQVCSAQNDFFMTQSEKDEWTAVETSLSSSTNARRVFLTMVIKDYANDENDNSIEGIRRKLDDDKKELTVAQQTTRWKNYGKFLEEDGSVLSQTCIDDDITKTERSTYEDLRKLAEKLGMTNFCKIPYIPALASAFSSFGSSSSSSSSSSSNIASLGSSSSGSSNIFVSSGGAPMSSRSSFSYGNAAPDISFNSRSSIGAPGS